VPSRTAPGPQPSEEEAPDLPSMPRTSTTATLRLPPRTPRRAKPPASEGNVFVLDDEGDDPSSILSELLKS